MELLYNLNRTFTNPVRLKFLFLGISIVINWAFGILIYLKNNKSIINRLFINIAIISGLCILADLLIDVFLKIYQINIGPLTAIDVPLFIFLTFFYFKITFYYPYGEVTPRQVLLFKVLLIISIALSVLSLTDLFISDRRIINGIYYRKYHFLYYVVIIYILLIFLLSMLHFCFKLKKTNDLYYRKEGKRIILALLFVILFLGLTFTFVLPLFNIKELDFVGKILAIDIATIIIGVNLLNYKVLTYKEEIKELFYYIGFSLFGIIPLMFVILYILSRIYRASLFLFFLLTPLFLIFFFFFLKIGFEKIKRLILYENIEKLNKETEIREKILKYIIMNEDFDYFVNNFISTFKEIFLVDKIDFYLHNEHNYFTKYTGNEATKVKIDNFWSHLKFNKIIYYEVLRKKAFAPYQEKVIKFMNKNNYYYIFINYFYYKKTKKPYFLCFSTKSNNGLIKTYELYFIEELLLFLNILLSFMFIRNEIKNIEYQLIKAQKMKNIAILTSGIAHDFNNILCGVINNIHLIETNYSIKVPEINSIKLLCDRGALIIKQLLNYSKKHPVDKDNEVNIIGIIKDAIEIASKSRNKKIRFDFEYEKDNVILTDQDNKLIEIFLNLFVNSIDAIENKIGNIKINLSLSLPEKYKQKFSKDRYLFLTISDNGKGIPKEHLKNIFQPFYSKKGKRATGLGLYIVKNIINEYGGSIEVESALNKGTTFYIILPYKKIGKREVSITPATKFEQREVFKGTILLIDDEEIILDSGEKLFNILGFRVLKAGTGRDAIELFEQYRKEISLVFTDIFMPDYTGIELVKLFRKKKKRLKVIFSSGWGDEKELKRWKKEKNVEFLQKPYTIQQIVEKLKLLNIKH